MSLKDKLQGIFNKGKGAVADNADKIGKAVDSAAGAASKATKGKYDDKINKASNAAKSSIPKKDEGGQNSGPAS